jgi:hypothetical protein
MIAIKSNKELYFPSGKGFVTMSMDMIINRPETGTYEMRIVDTCERETMMDNQPITQFVGFMTRFKTMTYEELDALAELLNVDMTVGSLRENINELFRQGLLIVTQKECVDGIYGEPGLGQYASQAQDWEIYRPTEEERPEQILDRK